MGALATIPAATAPLGDLDFSSAKARREHVRWLALLYIDRVRPEPMTDAALLPIVRQEYPDTKRDELRRELDYLCLRGLLRADKSPHAWTLGMTWRGIDVVEYTSDDVLGIGRPPFPL